MGHGIAHRSVDETLLLIGMTSNAYVRTDIIAIWLGSRSLGPVTLLILWTALSGNACTCRQNHKHEESAKPYHAFAPPKTDEREWVMLLFTVLYQKSVMLITKLK